MNQYEIRLPYELSESLIAVFPEMEGFRIGNSTVLVGVLQDQTELHGILARIAELGLEIIEVRKVPG